jgi:hypothetical protein
MEALVQQELWLIDARCYRLADWHSQMTVALHPGDPIAELMAFKCRSLRDLVSGKSLPTTGGCLSY